MAPDPQPPDPDPEAFWAWYEAGVAAGYCAPWTCDTHDPFPSTPAEDDAFDAGEDPCRVIVRIFPEGRPADLSPPLLDSR